MNKHINIKNTKLVARVVVSFSVKAVIATAIASVVPTETKTDKVKVVVATFVLSNLVADAAKTWTNDHIDDLVEVFKKPSLEETEA